jgi:hypothetical protein
MDLGYAARPDGGALAGLMSVGFKCDKAIFGVPSVIPTAVGKDVPCDCLDLVDTGHPH